MTGLDIRVAVLRGWTVPVYGDINGIEMCRGIRYSPSADLAQALALWDEARPEGRYLSALQQFNGYWAIKVLTSRGDTCIADIALTDLPRAITQAWVEAKEQEGKAQGDVC